MTILNDLLAYIQRHEEVFGFLPSAVALHPTDRMTLIRQAPAVKMKMVKPEEYGRLTLHGVLIVTDPLQKRWPKNRL